MSKPYRSKQNLDVIGREILERVISAGLDEINVLVDEGDGRTFWKHTLVIHTERLSAEDWIKEDQDEEDDDSRSERRAEDDFDNYRRGGLD